MGIVRTLAFIIVAMLCLATLAFAQDDIEGAKDHPLISRMPGYRIAEYEDKDFDSVPFMNEKGEEIAVEGKYTMVSYYIKEGAKASSEVQINRNYINALQKIGGKVVYQRPSEVVYLKIEKSGTITWVYVEPFNGGEGYTLYIVESKAMAQEVTADANALANDIAATGKAAVYGIYFDTGKSVVKPESEPALTEIGKLLGENGSLELHVVGHTDNVGDLASNMKLSQARAEAVVQALVSKYGVDAKRLKPAGVGPLCPAASNSTDEGKAKNRRVELVQQ
jgi:outer membrane protein OmpA-like peptidoglycan-associated protein